MAAGVAEAVGLMGAELDIGQLYAQHGAFIARTLERLAGPGAHVDDLLQETFIVAHRKRALFDPSRAAPSTWLYGIAQNLAWRHLRSSRRFSLFKGRFEREEAHTPIERPDEAAERAEAARLVASALQRLPLKQREVFALYELEGLDGPTIAGMVGVPVGTVWTRLHHARKGFEKHVRHQTAKEATA